MESIGWRQPASRYASDDVIYVQIIVHIQLLIHPSAFHPVGQPSSIPAEFRQVFRPSVRPLPAPQASLGEARLYSRQLQSHDRRGLLLL